MNRWRIRTGKRNRYSCSARRGSVPVSRKILNWGKYSSRHITICEKQPIDMKGRKGRKEQQGRHHRHRVRGKRQAQQNNNDNDMARFHLFLRTHRRLIIIPIIPAILIEQIFSLCVVLHSNKITCYYILFRRHTFERCLLILNFSINWFSHIVKLHGQREFQNNVSKSHKASENGGIAFPQFWFYRSHIIITIITIYFTIINAMPGHSHTSRVWLTNHSDYELTQSSIVCVWARNCWGKFGEM